MGMESGRDELNWRATTRCRAVAAALALALAACASPPPPKPVEPEPLIIKTPPPVVVVPPPKPEPAPVVVVTPPMSEDEQQALSLLSYLGELLGASGDDQKRELQNASQQFQKTKSDVNRVRLAVLYALPNTSFQDDAKAIGLLEGLGAKHPGTPVREFAAYLQAQILDRQRQVREEQKRADAIQQKLDSLKAIERSMLDRDRKARTSATPGNTADGH